MNRKYIVQLTEEERSQLQQIISSGTAPARKIRRAQILLKSDSSPQGPNWSYQAICAAFDVSAMTITTVRRAYGEGGLEAALNRKKPEREYPHRLDGEAEAHLIAMACSQPPEGHARWRKAAASMRRILEKRRLNMNARQPYPPSRKILLGAVLFVFLLTACGTQPALPATPTSPPTETPTPQPTLTPTPTETPVPTPTPIPTLPPQQAGGLSGIPDPHAAAPKLFDLSNPESPIPQFTNAMRMAGIQVDPQEVADNLQYQIITGADGKPYVIGAFNLDPDPNQQGETLEGPIPLMIGQKNENGEWGWRRATFQSKSEVGSLIEWWRSNSTYLKILTEEYNHLQIATAFNWYYLVHDSPQKFDYRNIDEALYFAQKTGKTVDANAITWGLRSALPDWLKNGNYSNEQSLTILKNHIETVMRRYKGKFERVIVVNEPWGNPWETSFWTEKLGLDNYIVNSFRSAREADPSTKLAINDFAIEFSGEKADRMFNLVKRLNEQELEINGKKLIDAVGLQMPLLLPGAGTNVNNFVNSEKRSIMMAQFRQNIRRYKEIGVEVFVSEALVDITDIPGTREEKLKIQAAIYADIIKVCQEEGVSFTMYGFHDDNNAYPEGAGRPNADPYLFDESYNPKPAYYAVLTVLIENFAK